MEKQIETLTAANATAAEEARGMVAQIAALQEQVRELEVGTGLERVSAELQREKKLKRAAAQAAAEAQRAMEGLLEQASGSRAAQLEAQLRELEAQHGAHLLASSTGVK